MPYKKGHSWSYNKAALESAVRDVFSGTLKLCSSAHKYGVPATTISNHLTKRGYIRKQKTNKKLTFIDQEIIRWIGLMAKMNCNSKRNYLSDIVRETLKRREKGSKVITKSGSVRWTERFLKRHKEISLDVETTDIVITRDSIEKWFEKQKLYIDDQCKIISNVTTESDTCPVYCCFKLAVVCVSNDGDIRLEYDHNYNLKELKMLVSIYICIGSNGTYLKPLITVKDEKLDTNNSESVLDACNILQGDIGDMQTDNMMLWLQMIENEIRSQNIHGPVVIYLDQSISPLSHSTLEYCINRDIILFYLPGGINPEEKLPIGMDIFLNLNVEFENIVALDLKETEYTIQSILEFVVRSWELMLVDHPETHEVKDFGLMPSNMELMMKTFNIISPNGSHIEENCTKSENSLVHEIEPNVIANKETSVNDSENGSLGNDFTDSRSFEDTGDEKDSKTKTHVEDNLKNTNELNNHEICMNTVKECNSCPNSKLRGIRCGIVQGLIFALKKIESSVSADILNMFKTWYVTPNSNFRIFNDPMFLIWFQLMKCLELGPQKVHEKYIDTIVKAFDERDNSLENETSKHHTIDTKNCLTDPVKFSHIQYHQEAIGIKSNEMDVYNHPKMFSSKRLPYVKPFQFPAVANSTTSYNNISSLNASDGSSWNGHSYKYPGDYYMQPKTHNIPHGCQFVSHLAPTEMQKMCVGGMTAHPSREDNSLFHYKSAGKDFTSVDNFYTNPGAFPNDSRPLDYPPGVEQQSFMQPTVQNIDSRAPSMPINEGSASCTFTSTPKQNGSFLYENGNNIRDVTCSNVQYNKGIVNRTFMPNNYVLPSAEDFTTVNIQQKQPLNFGDNKLHSDKQMLPIHPYPSQAVMSAYNGL